MDSPVYAPSTGMWGGGGVDAIAGGSGPTFAARQKIDQLLQVFPGFSPEAVAAALAECGGDRHAASGTLADMMAAERIAGTSSRAAGGAHAQVRYGHAGGVDGRGRGGEGSTRVRDIRDGGGDLSLVGGRQLSASHPISGSGGETLAHESDHSYGHSHDFDEDNIGDASDASEWEHVRRRSNPRSAPDAPRPSSSFSAEQEHDPTASHLERALANIRRRQAPEVAPESRRGEAALRRVVQQLHEQAAALQSSRASLSALSRAAFQRGDGKLAKELSQRAAVLEAKICAAKENAAQV